MRRRRASASRHRARSRPRASHDRSGEARSCARDGSTPRRKRPVGLAGQLAQRRQQLPVAPAVLAPADPAIMARVHATVEGPDLHAPRVMRIDRETASADARQQRLGLVRDRTLQREAHHVIAGERVDARSLRHRSRLSRPGSPGDVCFRRGARCRLDFALTPCAGITLNGGSAPVL
jgi:hypothetical protein